MAKDGAWALHQLRGNDLDGIDRNVMEQLPNEHGWQATVTTLTAAVRELRERNQALRVGLEKLCSDEEASTFEHYDGQSERCVMVERLQELLNSVDKV